VNLVALYVAPVWADAVLASRRQIGNQITDAPGGTHHRAEGGPSLPYRKPAYTAATVLAGVPPLVLLGQTHSEMYRRVKALREEGV